MKFGEPALFFDFMSGVEAGGDRVADSGCVDGGGGSDGGDCCGRGFGRWDDGGGHVLGGVDCTSLVMVAVTLPLAGLAVRPAVIYFIHQHRTNRNLLFAILHYQCILHEHCLKRFIFFANQASSPIALSSGDWGISA